MSDIQNLIDALDRTTAALLASNESRDAAVAAAKAATEKAKPTAKATKPADEPAAETPKADPVPAAETTAADVSGVPSVEDVKASVVAYIGDTAGAEREARSAKIKEIFGKVGATNAATVPEDKRDVFIRTMVDLGNRGNLVQESEPAGDADGLLG